MIINPYIYGVATSYDPDAQLFFNAQTAAGVTLTTTQMNAVNQWVVDAKAANIWTKFKAIYPFVGSTATAHKFNLKNPLDTNAAFRLVFYGGGTFSANGYSPGGVNGYADTFLTPSTALTNNNTHLSVYSRTNSSSGANASEIGSYVGIAYIDILIKEGSNSFVSDQYNFSTNRIAIANANSQGFYLSTRTSSTVFKAFKNSAQFGSTVTNVSNPSVNTIIGNIYLSSLNNSGVAVNFSNRELAFSTIGDGLTDLESQLFYQITEKYQVALGRNINALQSFYYNSAYNNETNAFLFSTQITDNTIQTATNTLVTDLKTANIFTKMKAIYPMVGGTATTHKFNLVNAQDTDAAYRLVFSGGGTHSSNGYSPGGVNGYANTFLNSLSNLTGTSTHLSYYSRTATPVNTTVEIGCGQVVPPYCALAVSVARAFDSGEEGGVARANFTTTTNAQGFWLGTKRSNTDRENYLNGISQTTKTVSDTLAFPNLTLYLGAINRGTPNLYSSKQCAFASIGDGLSDAEALALYNAVQTFNTTLARQV